MRFYVMDVPLPKKRVNEEENFTLKKYDICFNAQYTLNKSKKKETIFIQSDKIGMQKYIG